MKTARHDTPAGETPPGIEPAFRPAMVPSQVEEAWAGSLDLLESMASRGEVTVVVNDVTRPAVAARALAPVRSVLEGRCRVLVATGAHREVTCEEKDALLGGMFPEAPWRCTRADGEPSFGITARGTEMRFDPWVLQGGPLLVLGTVEPHYFAGFTGGRKSLLPGCASRRSIEQNHYLACLPGSAPCALEGNPVHEDMLEAALKALEGGESVFASAVVQGDRLVHLSTGEMTAAFAASVEESRRALCVTLDRPRSVVTARPGAPLDCNLYQSMKAVYNCERAVADGGVLLLDSDCAEGLGADFLASSLRQAMDPAWNPPGREGYRLGDHATVRLVAIRSRIRLALRSNLPRDLVESLGLEPVDDAGSMCCADAVTILDAGTVVPLIRDGCAPWAI